MDGTPIYCVPGMGVNGKIFAKVRVEGRPLKVIEWLEPQRKETLQEYAHRMAAHIEDDGPVDLLGLSFGGILAVEIARIRPVRHVFLISSIKSKQEKPLFFKLMRVAPFYLTNVRFLRNRTIWVWGRFFGLHNKRDLAFFNRITPDLSDRYHRWAVRQICRWKNEEVPSKIFHIHGNKDRIFPIRACEPHHVVHGADHSMIFTHGREVSRIIRERLSEAGDPAQGSTPNGFSSQAQA
jgi:pimeloyl-ACP methyl ester carboxylesterase